MDEKPQGATASAEVRAALALGTQAVQEVQAQAAERERQAVEEALTAERQRIAEAQKKREKEIVDRLSEIAEQEQQAAVAKVIQETEQRCAREASEWLKAHTASKVTAAPPREELLALRRTLEEEKQQELALQRRLWEEEKEVALREQHLQQERAAADARQKERAMLGVSMATMRAEVCVRTHARVSHSLSCVSTLRTLCGGCALARVSHSLWVHCAHCVAAGCLLVWQLRSVEEAYEQLKRGQHADIERVRAAATDKAIEATLVECERTTVELLQLTRREAAEESRLALQQASPTPSRRPLDALSSEPRLSRTAGAPPHPTPPPTPYRRDLTHTRFDAKPSSWRDVSCV